MSSTPEFRQAFVERLKQACDESPNVPPPYKGRQQFLAQKLGVAAEAVSKWFKAVSMPRPDKMVLLAELLGVEQSWLAFGLAPEMDRGERKAHVNAVSGAVSVAMGMTMLAGISCGFPSDTKDGLIDFYATIRGAVYPVHVCLGRQIAEDLFEVLVPKNYEDVRCLGVLYSDKGTAQLIDMPHDIIEECKIRKTGSFAIEVEKASGNRYATRNYTWPKVRFFGDTKGH